MGAASGQGNHAAQLEQVKKPCSRRRRSRVILAPVIAGLFGMTATFIHAACLPSSTPGSGQTVVCDGVISGSPSVIAQPASTGVSVTVNAAAAITTNASQAFEVDTSSSIVNNGQITVSGGSGGTRFAIGSDGDNNFLTNNGVIRTTSGSTAGISTAASGSGEGNRILNAGSITTTGGSSHGIVTFGHATTVTNSGTISVSGTASKGVFLQGGSPSGNVLINTGTIRATGSNTSATTGLADGVHANTTGVSFYSRVENRAGGVITSLNSYALRGQNGNDTFINAGYLEGHGGASGDAALYMGSLGIGYLTLQTGSVIRGVADGGINKYSNLYLEGSGVADNVFKNFEVLTMRGDAWSWQTDSTMVNSIAIQSGRFGLGAKLSSPTINVAAGAFVTGQGTFIGNVTNQGTWLPGPGAGNGFGALTVTGNYIGSNATLQINTVLGADASPSDKLVIDTGVASGSTTVRVTNIGGSGAQTLADGIVVVQAINGATSSGNAFTLSTPVEAGSFRYRLLRGGSAGNDPDSWFLRSSAFAVVLPQSREVVIVGSPEEAWQLAGPDAAVQAVNLYRPEVALFSAVPQMTRRAAVMQLGTYRDRQGADRDAIGMPSDATWVRLFGENSDQTLSGNADPRFDGRVRGLQVGHDVYAALGNSGALNRVGLQGGYTNANGAVSGLVGGIRNTGAGTLALQGYSAGAYWIHVAKTGWYTDTVLMRSRYRIDAQSIASRVGRPTGYVDVASIELGLPINLGGRFSNFAFEPQMQLIGQRSTYSGSEDGVSTVQIDRDKSLTARLGLVLQGLQGKTSWRPYIKTNFWHTFGGSSGVRFGQDDAVGTRRNASAIEVGAGAAGRLSRAIAIHAGMSLTAALGNTHLRSTQMNAGLQYSW